MSRIYDIAERLATKNQRPTVCIDASHEYRINTAAPAALMVQSISEDTKLSEVDRIYKIITAALGEEAVEHIRSMDYSIPALSLIVMTIIAAMADEDLETIEEDTGMADAPEGARFQKKKKGK